MKKGNRNTGEATETRPERRALAARVRERTGPGAGARLRVRFERRRGGEERRGES